MMQQYIKIDTKRPNKGNIEDGVLVSWVLDAVRRVLGLEDIRKDILKYFIPVKYHDQITFGLTFGSEAKPKEIEKYLESLVLSNNKKLILFTASNLALNSETHYQSFVLDPIHKHLFVIDPSSFMGQVGIYEPYVAMTVIVPFLKQFGFTSEFVKLSNPAQSTDDDIFCQTWSLFLQIQFMKSYLHSNDHKVIILDISKSLRIRYKYLIAFYKSCLKNISNFCRDLNEIYIHEISKSKYLVVGIKSADERKLLRNYYKSFDPCMQLKKMNEIDLMSDDQIQTIVKK